MCYTWLVITLLGVLCGIVCQGQQTSSKQVQFCHHADLNTLQFRMDLLKRKCSASQQLVESLQQRVEQVESERVSLKQQLDWGKTEREGMQQTLDSQAIQLQKLQQQVSDMGGGFAKATPQVGFSAYMNVGDLNPETSTIIPFNGVLLNQGSNYNPATSIYTCPINGTYLFMFYLYSGKIRYGADGFKTEGILKKDDQNLAFALCQNENANSLALTCGNSVITHCVQGSEVSVMNYWEGVKISGTSSHRQTTFSGVLLYTDE